MRLYIIVYLGRYYVMTMFEIRSILNYNMYNAATLESFEFRQSCTMQLNMFYRSKTNYTI